MTKRRTSATRQIWVVNTSRPVRCSRLQTTSCGFYDFARKGGSLALTRPGLLATKCLVACAMSLHASFIGVGNGYSYRQLCGCHRSGFLA